MFPVEGQIDDRLPRVATGSMLQPQVMLVSLKVKLVWG